jgi:hypothetical protein
VHLQVALLWEGLVQLGLVKGPFNLLQFYNFNRTQIGEFSSPPIPFVAFFDSLVSFFGDKIITSWIWWS